ncbi:pyridoxamine 5'-phosphate oxidase family protein [Rhodovibrionaceae bacterium A322]
MATSRKLNRKFREFIEKQPLFFVATAAREGRVNVSPKGVDSLRILDEKRIVWINYSGSGNETAAHLLDSPRMTLMFAAFEGAALILRVYGTARVIHPRDAGWDELHALFPAQAGSRQIFDLSVELVQTSCGTGVPEMSFIRSRAESELFPFYEEMGPEGVRDYWSRKNVTSLDGAPTGIFEEGAGD